MRILKHPESEAPSKALLCSNNEILKLIDLHTGQVQQTLEDGHTDIILCVDQNKESNLFLSGSKDNTIRLWNKNLKCLAVFSGHNENVASVYFAPKKGNFFVSAS